MIVSEDTHAPCPLDSPQPTCLASQPQQMGAAGMLRKLARQIMPRAARLIPPVPQLTTEQAQQQSYVVLHCKQNTQLGYQYAVQVPQQKA